MAMDEAQKASFIAQAKIHGRRGGQLSHSERSRESKPVKAPPGAKAVTFRKVGSVAHCISAFAVKLVAASLLNPARKNHTWLHCYDLADWNASHCHRPAPLLSLLVRADEEIRRDDLAVNCPNGLIIAASVDPEGRAGTPGPLLGANFWVELAQ
jgi:hypothetical protein